MQEILTLYCGIENCNTHYEYKYDKDNIVAITGQWRNEKSKSGIWGGLLAELPQVGQIYELFIQSAVKMNLSEKFWTVYFEPYTEHEGIDFESGIDSMLICLCEKKNIIDIKKTNARIEIEVIEVKKITDNNEINTVFNQRTEFLNEEISSKCVSIENFERFSMIKANYQSDCGWTYIIEKKEGRSKIVAENNWDFHKDIWRLIHEEISPEQEKKYGIQHNL